MPQQTRKGKPRPEATVNQTVRLTSPELRQVAQKARAAGLSKHRWMQRVVRQALTGSDVA